MCPAPVRSRPRWRSSSGRRRHRPTPDGRVALVSQVSTLADHRGRGHARACLTTLLDQLDSEGIVRTDLHATPDGHGLYLRLGFRPAPYPSLRRARPTA